MIVDWHAHYPMHLRETAQERPPGTPLTAGDLLHTVLLAIANAFFNYHNFKPVVTIENLRQGNVKVALSVLYEPFAEIDLTKERNAPPDPSYFRDLRQLKDAVERDIAARPDAMIAHNPRELLAGLATDKTILIHAVEGGFYVGPTEADVIQQVAELKEWGVAYMTVAHLFFRQVASNAPALPFMSDAHYHQLFPQDGAALTPLGECLVREMVKQHILIDITHMSRPAIDATLALLAQLDPAPGDPIPLVATHSAYDFGGVEYNISDAHIKAVAARRGVIGLITCRHWMTMGKDKPKTIDQTMDLIVEHIEAIRAQAGGYDNIAIGSDMDGFIKPGLHGLDGPADFAAIESGLQQRYASVDPTIGTRITADNSLELLKRYWIGR